MRIAIYGHNGWIGNLFINYLLSNSEKTGIKDANIFRSQTRLEYRNYSTVMNELTKNEITHVFVCVGTTRDNSRKTNTTEVAVNLDSIDYIQNKLDININNNLFAQLMMINIADKLNIHTTILGTGCIYDDTHYLENMKSGSYKYSEDDIPNYTGSNYSIIKSTLNNHIGMVNSPNILHLRIRMPIWNGTDKYDYIAKIVKYRTVIDIPNSMTVLKDVFPIMIDMMGKKKIGTYNLTNPNIISPYEILELYQQIVDSEFKYTLISSQQLHEKTVGKRCNVELDLSKILEEYHLPDIRHSIIDILEEMAKSKSE
jgi:3,5-epimerase/4-reductase